MVTNWHSHTNLGQKQAFDSDNKSGSTEGTTESENDKPDDTTDLKTREGPPVTQTYEAFAASLGKYLFGLRSELGSLEDTVRKQGY